MPTELHKLKLCLDVVAEVVQSYARLTRALFRPSSLNLYEGTKGLLDIARCLETLETGKARHRSDCRSTILNDPASPLHETVLELTRGRGDPRTVLRKGYYDVFPMLETLGRRCEAQLALLPRSTRWFEVEVRGNEAAPTPVSLELAKGPTVSAVWCAYFHPVVFSTHPWLPGLEAVVLPDTLRRPFVYCCYPFSPFNFFDSLREVWCGPQERPPEPPHELVLALVREVASMLPSLLRESPGRPQREWLRLGRLRLLLKERRIVVPYEATPVDRLPNGNYEQTYPRLRALMEEILQELWPTPPTVDVRY